MTNAAEALCALQFADDRAHFTHTLQRYHYTDTVRESPAPAYITDALQRYFNGQYTALNDIRIQMPGSVFQQRVWSLLRTLPAGTTSTYGELAQKLGDTSCARAVGAANAANPIALIIPCHRVIGKNGSLKNFAWGIERKQWLLHHENACR